MPAHGHDIEDAARELYGDLDHCAIERAALKAGVDIDEQTSAAHDEIERQLVTAGAILARQAPEDGAFERYDFGPGVTVESADGWERSTGSTEVSRAVYVRYDDDAADADTHRVMFTVRLADGKVAEAWASTNKGEQMGYLPMASLEERVNDKMAQLGQALLALAPARRKRHP